MIFKLGLRVCLLSLAVCVGAKDASDYSPTENFRPHNVTGLNGFYNWVGSYFNGTTELQLNPISGRLPQSSLCENLRNVSTTIKRGSILSITERGSYNDGPNPVNLILNFLTDDFNWTKVPSGKDVWDDANLTWPLMSAEPQWSNRSTAPDNFNMTISKESSTFNLSGAVRNSYEYNWNATYGFGHFSMPACDPSADTGRWKGMPQVAKWTNTENWSGFRFPVMNASFDARSANLTLSGLFEADSYLRKNATQTYDIGGGVLGTFQLHFHGVLDTYHSDVLNVNSTSPTWLRTVGFGNNSLNIGYAENAAERAHLGWGSVSIMALSLLFGIVLGA